MRTSRIAQDTSRISTLLTPTKPVSRRQTRSFASSISTYAANVSATQNPPKRAPDDEDSSSLSSAPSPTCDIEDYPAVLSNPRKRKRGAATPSTAATSVKTNTSARTSPRKAGIKIKDEEEDKKPVHGNAARPKKPKRQPAKETLNGVGEVTIHPPPQWEEVYEAVREQRKQVLAPVDTMGCERLADTSMSPKDQRFQTLISLMLSSQTKDTTTALAIRNLQRSLPGGLTLSSILSTAAETLNALIYAVGFHNNKTRYIKATALVLSQQHGGDIPSTVNGLMALPGVGPKMAYLCMSAAWGRTEGIGVDVHVHRITNLWGWHRTRGPEETRHALEAWLPRERWHEINHLLVGFGQTVCLPVGRRCGGCEVGRRGLCPSAVADKKRPVVRVKRKEEGVDEGETGVLVRAREEVLGEEDAVRAGGARSMVKDEEVLEGGMVMGTVRDGAVLKEEEETD